MPGVLFMEKRKAIIFIDGSNWYHNSKYIIKPGNINFDTLSKHICNHFNLELKEIRYYNAIPDISDGEKVYYKHIKFLNNLKKQGIIVSTRKLKKILKTNVSIEKGVDVLIGADMMGKTLVDKKCDVCILISGDADFIPVMEIIKESKKEAITCSVLKGYARELLQGKFRYLILKEGDLNKCLK
jgi:uncharacterized LabA/DUF88 family protein|tara:strand:- start:283 stop:834 length:552 start_codon:yes stop_codon:yes gene_type:complete